MTKRSFRIAVLPGDGIGPEVTEAALQVLEGVSSRFDLEVETRSHPIGWAGVQEAEHPLPAETRRAVEEVDAVFLGAVGDPRGDDLPPELRPEAGLLELRKTLDCFANLRPAKAIPALEEASPLRPERVRGMDFVIVRELSSGLYYGEPRLLDRSGEESFAVNTMRYTEGEIRRVARVGFDTARRRNGRVVSVDKANVLETSRLWREVVSAIAEEYPDVELDHMLVDRAAMELVLQPTEFDVILTENLFGDVLSDEAAALTGSIGLLASASLGQRAGIFEPVHGSAPDLAGRGVANPLAAILSMALLLEHGAKHPEAAAAIEGAVENVLAAGVRSPELARAGERASGTREIADEVTRALENP